MQDRPSALKLWKELLLDLSPAAPGITALECGRIMLGMGLAIGLTALISQWVAHEQLELFWQGASISATAFLLFALPSSPLAQPWAILVGNLSAGAIGMACSYWVSHTVLAASMAVPLSVLAMMQLRAVHPPATAVALYMVLKHVQAPEVLLFPLGFNLVVLVVVGTVFNRMTGRRYPYRQITRSSSSTEGDRGEVSPSDVDQALARYNEVLAISRDDLTSLLQVASGVAYQRHLGDLRCSDVMTTDVQSARADAPLEDLRILLGNTKHRELPVVDEHNRLLGAVGLSQWFDVLNALAQKNASAAALQHAPTETGAPQQSEPTAQGTDTTWSQRLWRTMKFIRLSPPQTASSSYPATASPHGQAADADTSVPPHTGARKVRDVMVPSVVIAHPQQALMEIIPILSQGGRYLIPVVDEQHILQGIITQTDLLRALDRALPQPGTGP